MSNFLENTKDYEQDAPVAHSAEMEGFLAGDELLAQPSLRGVNLKFQKRTEFGSDYVPVTKNLEWGHARHDTLSALAPGDDEDERLAAIEAA